MNLGDMKTGDMTTNIEINLRLQRGDFLLEADLSLPAHGVTVLFGHSGSGKTSLLRCIAGLEKAEADIVFQGRVWQSANTWIPTHQRPLAYVFQEASLFDHLSANGNLEFAIKRARGPVSAADKQNIIELLGIGHTLARYPSQLSGGERQRVAIARALLSRPQLLLMDEPLASLDEQRKQEILPYLEQLKSQLDLPIIYVTHSPAEVARLADTLIALKDGRVVASGPITETLSDPAFPLHLGEEASVVLDGTVAERDSEWQLARIAISSHSIWLRDNGQMEGKAVRVRILARDVSLALTPQTDSSISNALPCVVETLVEDCHDALALVRVRIGELPLLARMTRRSVTQLKLEPGKAMWAQVKSAALI
jgi:molybdate transport system ATP-binding protein